MYSHLGGNELAAMAQGRWPSLSGHSFRFEETSPLSRHTPGRNGGHYTTNGLDRGGAFFTARYLTPLAKSVYIAVAGGENNRYLPGKQYGILRKGKAVIYA